MISSENTFLTSAEDDFQMRSSSFEGPLRYFSGSPLHDFAEGQNFHLRSNLGLLRISTGTTTVYSHPARGLNRKEGNKSTIPLDASEKRRTFCTSKQLQPSCDINRITDTVT